MNELIFNPSLARIIKDQGAALAKREGLPEGSVTQGLKAGSMVLLANPNHKDVIPTLIGRPAEIKVNANLGTSPLMNDSRVEKEKLAAAEKAGAHAVMDLSTGGDLDEIRRDMLATTRLPLGTVPIYAVAAKCVAQDRDPADFEPAELFEEIQRQAEQGVDFMTLHCGVTRRGAELADRPGRVMGIVSRGGSILARWMRKHNKENPLLTEYGEIMKLLAVHNVTISLGDGLRPGAGADAGDPAQWEEIVTLGELTLKAREAGVQAMVEGPGHVPLHLVEGQIRSIKRATYGAPLYVLGPLVTDCAPGYDHIGGAIGGAVAAMSGADFLCYVTPAEHLTLPCPEDVHAGVKASLIAAHAGHVAQGDLKATARDLDISKARADLDWERMASLSLDPELVAKRREAHKSEKECAMCGRFCAVKMLSE